MGVHQCLSKRMMTRSPLFICMLLIAGLVQCFAAFSQHSGLHSQSSQQVRLNLPPLSLIKKFDRLEQHGLYSSRDEEIADLEKKLRQLKEGAETKEVAETEEGAEETEVTSTEKSDTSDGEFVERRFKISDDSTNMMVTGEELPKRSAVEPYEELLSEQWKVRESDSVGFKDLLLQLAPVLAIIVGLIAFSQVPIGQEGLDRYSTAKPSTSIDLGDLNPVGENQQ